MQTLTTSTPHQQSAAAVPDCRFKVPFTAVVAGPSRCRKTKFVVNFLRYPRYAAQLLYFERIVYCYGELISDTFQTLKNILPEQTKLEIHEGLPDIEALNFNKEVDNLIILDDLMTEALNDKVISDLFTKFSHHRNISCFLLVQNLYEKAKYSVTINRQLNYLIIFKSPRDKNQLSYLGRQLFL
jgi:hypothetical protein